MIIRVAFCLLLYCACLSAQEVPPAVPAAAQRYLDILSKRPLPGTLFERFYAAWLEEGTAAELQQYLEARAGKTDASPTDHLILAIFHAHRGNDTEALLSYQAALKLNPINASAWMECSRIEARMLDFPAALQSLDRAEAANPAALQQVDIGKLRGRALLRLGRSEDALKIWKSLAAANADDEDLNEEIIDLFVDEGQFEAALEAARALVLRSRDPVAKIMRQLRLTDILQLAERRDEALATLDSAFATTGTDSWIESDILARIERLFRMSDDVSGLQQHLAALAKAHPQRVTLAWQHTLLLAATGQNDAALQSARTLLQSNPGRRDLRDGFLDLLDSLSLPREAVEQAKLIVAQNPGDKELLVRLASLQHRAGDDPAAVMTLEPILSGSPPDESDFLRIARLLESWEEPPVKADSPAAKAYLRLVTTFPQSLSAQEAHAHYLHRTGHREEALVIWRRMAETASLEDLLRIAQALQARLESRPSLDVLLGREKDFATQPRFLALLVHQAIANKEFERALPWARARLRLMPDAEGIDNALQDIIVIVRSERQNLILALVSELQSLPSLTLQDRCLLAAMLDHSGKTPEAETLLNAAPAQEALIALDQLSHLYQSHQEWVKATQTLQRMLDQPGGRTSSTLQRMVDLSRRALQPEQALKYIAEWKTVSPGAVHPWLLEARVLEDLFRPEAALKVLRLALRKFPDASDVAAACATACLDAGQAEEAERIYLAAYEKAPDPASRLRMLAPLANAAQSHGGLPALVQNFVQRQKQNRVSAYPWLALAEIHRATSNDEERRRCLYEASRLRPQDLTLLLEIARSEEDVGLTTEALRTLETAAKLDKTTQTREHIARLQIEDGDPDIGYRMLYDLVGSSDMDARALEQMAIVIATRGEWERVTAFLSPLLEKHPHDYRLHYLHAMALEETGDEPKAMQAFMRVLAMHEELPAAPGQAQPQKNQTASSQQDLPPGAADWLALPGIARVAYSHREERNSNLLPPVHGSAAAGQISLPPSVIESPTFALVHLLQISSVWPEDEQARLIVQLKREGVDHAGLLLELAQQSTEFQVTLEMLAAHPQDAALHAAWLKHSTHDDPAETAAACQRCFEMFKGTFSYLALRAAYLACENAESTASSTAWAQRIIDLCSPLPRSHADEWSILLDLLSTQAEKANDSEQQPAGSINPAQLQSITSILRRWMLAMDSSQLSDLEDLVDSFLEIKAWDAVLECLQHMMQLAGQPNAPKGNARRRAASPQFSAFEAQPLPFESTSILLPPYMAEMLVEILDALQDKSTLDDQESNLISGFQTAIAPRLASISDPRLKFMLHMMCEKGAEVLAELQPRLDSPAATAGDFLTAGWICQEMQQHAAALDHFQHALKLALTNDVRLQAANAMLFQAEQLGEAGEPGQKMAAIREMVALALPHASTREEKEILADIMEEYDMEPAAEKLRQSLPPPPVPVAVQSPHAILNPYSRALLQGGSVDGRDALERHLAQNNIPGALNEARRLVRLLVTEWLNPQSSQTADKLTQLLLKLEIQQLRQPLLLSLKTAAENGWKQRLEHAAVLEMQYVHGRAFQNNDGDQTLTSEALREHAVTEYSAVLKTNLQAHAASQRLVMLFAPTDTSNALKHWRSLPDTLQLTLLSPLTLQIGSSIQTTAQSIAVTRLVTQWIKNMDPAGPLPSKCTHLIEMVLDKIQQGGKNYPSLWESGVNDRRMDGSLREWKLDDSGAPLLDEASRRARNERRIAHDALCRAMTAVPELAEIGFAPLAGLAMYEGRNIEETEKLALQILSAPVSRQLQRRQNQRRQPAGNHDAIDSSRFQTGLSIAMPSPAVFATWSAAQRGDTRMLEDTLFPIILKAESQPLVDFCRGYAAVLMSKDQEFPKAAADWLRPWNQRETRFIPGGMAGEIVRLWQTRKITAPLDDLIIEYREATLPELMAKADPFAARPQASVLDHYVQALIQREPEALPRFMRRLRDVWVSPDASLRQQAIQTIRDNEKTGKPRKHTPLERATRQYQEWLQRLIQDGRGSFAALELALEDDSSESEFWMGQIDSSELTARLQTPENFIRIAHVLGFLRPAADFHPFASAHMNQKDVMASFAWHFRDVQQDSVINAIIERLGKEHPSSLSTHWLQAMLVRAGITTLWLDGKPVKLQAADPKSPSGLCNSAFRLVLIRHAADIAAMPVDERQNLGAFLKIQLSGFPHLDIADAAFKHAVAPILKAESEALLQKADTMISSKTWEEFNPMENHPEQLIALLKTLAAEDLPRAKALAQHGVQLLNNSKFQRAFVSEGQPDTPVSNYIMSLGHVPQLLGTSLVLAEENGLHHSLSWCGNTCYRFEDALKNPETALWVFQGTPFTAASTAFRDMRVDDASEPTLLARIIDCVEQEHETCANVRQWLARQPATFGTELLLALLHRGTQEEKGLLSFYDKPHRPDDAKILTFIRQHREDFTRLTPDTAVALLVLFQARIPDLHSRCEADPKLKSALQPLVEVDARQLESALQNFLHYTSLQQARFGEYEASQRGVQFLERLAPMDKPRAIEVLDHVSKLMATEEIIARSKGRLSPPHQTLIAQWLQRAATTPELFEEIMQRATECGAAGNLSWMQGALTRLMDIHRLRNQPERFVSLLEATHILDPAATFDPQRIPMEKDRPTLLETWLPTLVQWHEMKPLILKHRPNVFGADLLRLLLLPDPKEVEIVAFAKSHQAEMAATTPEQQKTIAALLHRLGFSKLISPYIPTSQDEP